MLEHLAEHLFVDVQVLGEIFGVSLATVRRDLSELEARGMLKRTHGGAVSINQVTRDSAVAAREITNAREKAAIGAVAADMIVEGDAVLIDGGTTSLQVAKNLAHRMTLTFITNGTDVLSALVAGGARDVFFIGGQYVDINHSFGGALAAEAVRKFNVDKAILSVSSVDLGRGLICTSTPQIACVQQAMIEIAQTVIVVADYLKFGRTTLSVIAPLDDVDYIVTDAATRSAITIDSDELEKKLVFA